MKMAGDAADRFFERYCPGPIEIVLAVLAKMGNYLMDSSGRIGVLLIAAWLIVLLCGMARGTTADIPLIGVSGRSDARSSPLGASDLKPRVPGALADHLRSAGSRDSQVAPGHGPTSDRKPQASAAVRFPPDPETLIGSAGLRADSFNAGEDKRLRRSVMVVDHK